MFIFNRKYIFIPGPFSNAMFVYKSVYTPQNEQHVCPWKWWLGNGNYFHFGAKGLIFKGLRCWFLGKVRVFGNGHASIEIQIGSGSVDPCFLYNIIPE